MFKIIPCNFRGKHEGERGQLERVQNIPLSRGFRGNRDSLLVADRGKGGRGGGGGYREKGERGKPLLGRQPILRRHATASWQIARRRRGPPAGLIKSNHRQFCPRETFANLRLLTLFEA